MLETIAGIIGITGATVAIVLGIRKDARETAEAHRKAEDHAHKMARRAINGPR